MSSRFEIHTTPIADLHLLQRKPNSDERGFFERLFCIEDLQAILSGRQIVQINHSYTARRGAARGLHFQRQPHAEMKFVQCLRGEVFDVAVDLRRGSPTFLKWHGEILSDKNHRTLVIPEGFAHGFQALTDECVLLYLVTAPYCPTAEGGLHLLDPRLGITWPLPVTQLSPRDAALPHLADDFTGVE